MRRVSSWTFAFSVISVACGSSDDSGPPADVSGSYSMNVTNRTNDCGLQNWTEGAQTNAIPMTITQDGSSISGTIDGLVGGYVKLVIGSNAFSGSVDGNAMHAVTYGTTQYKKNGCAYTLTLDMNAGLSGNSLQGTIGYRPKTNGSPDCGALETCQNIQDFAGSRAPK